MARSKDWLYVNTADDERLWEYNVLTNGSDYTLRDLDGKPLRIVRQDSNTWTWKDDTIRRDGQVLAAVRPSGAVFYERSEVIDREARETGIARASRDIAAM